MIEFRRYSVAAVYTHEPYHDKHDYYTKSSLICLYLPGT
jgi:hypothetical protein